MTRRFYRYNFLHFWIFIFYLGSCHRLISASNSFTPYPYGLQAGDAFFGNADDELAAFPLKKNINFINSCFKQLYVSVNGYVCLGKKYKTIYPSVFPSPKDIPIIAPFFADADARGYKSSGIYMQEYLLLENSTQTNKVLQRATNDIAHFQTYVKNNPSSNTYGVFNNIVNRFQANHVIVITWHGLLPSPYTYYVAANTTNTFQLILISNGVNLFSIFHFDIGKMLWYRVSIQRPTSGYSFGVTPYYHEISYSRSTTMLRIDRYNGNFGLKSTWAFRLDNSLTNSSYFTNGDIDECLSNACTGSSCVPIPNNSNCTCEENNICLPNPCIHGKCNKTKEEYSCNCNPGWTGKNCDTDIDECKITSSCSADASCTNVPGSFRCQCREGYHGNGTYCEDFYTIIYEETVHGSGRDDVVSLPLKDEIPIEGSCYKNLYISVNGYVSFGKKYENPYPLTFPSPKNIPIIAPFYSDADARGYKTSGILMHEYTLKDQSALAKGIFKRAANDVAALQDYMRANPSSTNYGLFNRTVDSFNVSQVVIITWQDLLPAPYNYYVNLRTTNTFQLILISNGVNLFGFFLYKIGGMLWYKVSIRRPACGYSFGVAPYFYEIPYARSTTMLRIDRFKGNFGQKSIWGFRLDNPDNSSMTFNIGACTPSKPVTFSIVNGTSIPSAILTGNNTISVQTGIILLQQNTISDNPAVLSQEMNHLEEILARTQIQNTSLAYKTKFTEVYYRELGKISLKVASIPDPTIKNQLFTTAVTASDDLQAKIAKTLRVGQEIVIKSEIIELHISAIQPDSTFEGYRAKLVANNTSDKSINLNLSNRSISTGSKVVISVGLMPTLNQVFTNTRNLSAIISCTVYPKSAFNGNEREFRYRFDHESANESSNFTCVFWNLTLSKWSSQGCHVAERAANYTVCSCNHLTHFALQRHNIKTEIIEPSGKLKALRILAYVFVGASIIILIVTLVTYLYLSLNTERSLIQKNLIVAILIAQMSLILGISTSKGQVLCKISTILFHLFYLASLTWISVEGLYFYFMITAAIYQRNKSRFYFIIGWGIPTLIVGITVATHINQYGLDEGCWISYNSSMFLALFTPILILTLANSIIFLVVLRKLIIKRASITSENVTKNDKLIKIKSEFKAAAVLWSILVLSWCLGIIPIGYNPTAYSYLFIIFNSLQGLHILIFSCLLNREVKSAWVATRRKAILVTSQKMNSGRANSDNMKDPNTSASRSKGPFYVKLSS